MLRIAPKKYLIVSIVLGTLIGCADYKLGATEKGAIGGTALGAGLGAIIGNQTGNAGPGIAIGSAAGAIIGGGLGYGIDKKDEELDRIDGRLATQEEQLAENRRILNELRSRGADARETDRGIVVVLRDIYFDFNSARLTGEARQTSRQISEVLLDVGGRGISVEGHTDSIGTMSYNQKLSESRARSVADELVASGVSRRRIDVRGFGESDPVASNSSESGRAKNRRVEVIIENN